MYTATLQRGIFPWNEPRKRLSGRQLEIHGGDSKEQIAACLGCQKSRCVNCVDAGKNGYVPRTYRYEKQCRIREKFLELYKQQVGMDEICQEMGISPRTYKRYCKNYLEGE